MTSVTELVKLFNAGYSTVNVRIKRGETPEEIEIALQQSHVKNPGKHRYKGEYLTIREICELTGINNSTLCYYTDRDIEPEEAIDSVRRHEKTVNLIAEVVIK